MSDLEEVMMEYIEISTHRTKVFYALKDGSRKPSDIARDVNLHINNVSYALKQLSEKELVYLLNPDIRKGRLYKLTDLGENIMEELNKKNNN